MSRITPQKAIQFLYPNLDAPEAQAGLRYDARGRIALVSENGAVRQSILLLLATRPGERVMRPAYGCEIHKLLFAPADDTTCGLAIHYVKQALERWEPRIDIIRLDAERDPRQPHRLLITLNYRVRANRQIDLLTIAFDLQGENR
jgi:hypothetical protein